MVLAHVFSRDGAATFGTADNKHINDINGLI